ncbi:MAG: phosphate ABC transporter substrate-binding protein [Candidatus Fraserbacteria bacterium RBG_16_55_9]|uniref:Phosphate ABC transporter substrate-binding protein n=1 Tax=Fraserbacteria sp. (strain RBG_16_55_9) TaxID=1817864 RepID=A0A1F5UP48_FRAXR|nr:MAG: phosphate ABC transporter substrate-binding protein [Candidatus Fraserbacteria bacterium RBG_16_55_9]
MPKKTLTSLLLASLLLFITGQAQPELEGTITVSGAFALYPMMVKWSEEFRAIHPKVNIDISAGGAGKGMADVLAGLVDIAMVSREIRPEETQKGAFGIAVVKDAVFPTVNENNPVLNDLLARGATKATFIGIWIEGRIKTWGQVVSRTDVTAPINVYTRSDSSGAAEVWAKFLGERAQEDLLGTGVFGDPGIADAVARDSLGIGYNNLGFAFDPDSKRPVRGLVVLPIDVNENGQVDPEEGPYTTRDQAMEAVSGGTYPSPPARELNLVTLGKPTGLAQLFLIWILADGQQFVSEAGFIPLSQERLQEELGKLQ